MNIPNEERIKKLRKLISDRKRRFNNLSQKKQRIAIARDVIKMLKNNQIKASMNSGYFSAPGFDSLRISLNSFDKDVHVLVDSIRCEVCALGGMLAATVMKVDGMKFENIFYPELERNEVIAKLKNYFSINQLDLIESAYEMKPMGRFRTIGYVYTTVNDDQCASAVNFGRLFYDGPFDRMIAIMQNIIDHNGTFTP